jgi:hypothetical protein
MASVTKVNIKIPQGTTYRHEYNYVDSDGVVIPLTGYSARCQFRDEIATVANFYDATSAGGELVIDEPNGQVVLLVSAAASTAFIVYKGFYDIEVVAPNGDVARIVQGKVTIDPEVTR